MGKICNRARNWESQRQRKFPQEVETKGWYSWGNYQQKGREPENEKGRD